MRKHPAVAMKAGDLRELYTYLKLFGQVYTDCGRERQILGHGIGEVFGWEYSGRDACGVLQAMGNPGESPDNQAHGLSHIPSDLLCEIF